MKILKPELIKCCLNISGLYLTGFELLQNSLINRLKEFLCEVKGIENGEITFKTTPAWKAIIEQQHPELGNKRNEFYSCSKWYLDEKIISKTEFDLLQKIRKHRNTIAHKLPEFLIDDNKVPDLKLFENLKELLEKVEWYWLEIEISFHPEFDNQPIDKNTTCPTVVSLMNYLIEIAQTELETVKDEKRFDRDAP
jgi:hypothetical protein